jgi:hypothetical protein
MSASEFPPPELKERTSMKQSVFLLAVIGLSFCVGCSKHEVGTLILDPDQLEVRIRQKGTDCAVDYEAVNVRTTTAAMAADQIRWCVKSGVATQYFIHFTSNAGNNSPFTDNDFLVNQNPFLAKTCSDFRSPLAGKPLMAYDYEIHRDSAAGPACSDPKVILK